MPKTMTGIGFWNQDPQIWVLGPSGPASARPPHNLPQQTNCMVAIHVVQGGVSHCSLGISPSSPLSEVVADEVLDMEQELDMQEEFATDALNGTSCKNFILTGAPSYGDSLLQGDCVFVRFCREGMAAPS